MSDKPNTSDLDSLFSKPTARKDPFGAIGVNPATQSMIASTEAVARPPAQPATNQYQSAPKAVFPTASEVSIDLKPPVQASQELMTSSFEDIVLGETISDQPIERFRGSPNFIHRISIVANTGKAVRTHYVDGLGTFYAIPGVTDTKLGAPTLRICIPVVIYTTDERGNVVSPHVSVKYLQLPKRSYDEFIAANSSRALDQCDYLVTCTDERRQNLSFQNIGPAAWRRNSDFESYVVQLYKSCWSAVGQAVARTFSAQEFLASMGESGFQRGGDSYTAAPAGDFNLDDFLKKG